MPLPIPYPIIMRIDEGSPVSCYEVLCGGEYGYSDICDIFEEVLRDIQKETDLYGSDILEMMRAPY